MRSLEELQREAFARRNNNVDFMVINLMELRMLKEYGMVEGTSNKNLVKAGETFGVTIDFIIKDALV